MTTDGTLTNEYPLPNGFSPGDIGPGPDGRLWFTESEANKIGAITMQGNITEYDLAPLTDPSGIAASAGAVWFTEFGQSQIGRIPVVGIPITHFGPTGAGPSGIAFGSDGALWFTETTANRIGRMTTSGTHTSFPVPTPGSEPGDIVAGPDGAMWFAEYVGNNIARIDVGGTFVPPPPTGSGGPGATSTTKPKARCRVPAVRGLTVRKALKKCAAPSAATACAGRAGSCPRNRVPGRALPAGSC